MTNVTPTVENDAPLRDWFIEHRGALVPLTYAEYVEVFEEAFDNPGRALSLMDDHLARVIPPGSSAPVSNGRRDG